MDWRHQYPKPMVSFDGLATTPSAFEAARANLREFCKEKKITAWTCKSFEKLTWDDNMWTSCCRCQFLSEYAPEDSIKEGYNR